MKISLNKYRRIEQDYEQEQEKSLSILILALALALILLLVSCGKNYSPEQKAYITKIEKAREEKNEFMRNNSYSPFNTGYKVEFSD
ncbi:MAG: hypothetical protein AB1298_01105, partial [Bacteroidota bacterium]